jgi:hypothetical protein
MNPYLASPNNIKFLGIQLPPAIKGLVTSVKSDITKLLFALVVPALQPKLLLSRNNNHTVKAFMMNHPSIQCLLKLQQPWKRGLYLLDAKGSNKLKQDILVLNTLLP